MIVEFYKTEKGKKPAGDFIKKQQKTPPEETNLAKKYKADYERRNK